MLLHVWQKNNCSLLLVCQQKTTNWTNKLRWANISISLSLKPIISKTQQWKCHSHNLWISSVGERTMYHVVLLSVGNRELYGTYKNTMYMVRKKMYYLASATALIWNVHCTACASENGRSKPHFICLQPFIIFKWFLHGM